MMTIEQRRSNILSSIKSLIQDESKMEYVEKVIQNILSDSASYLTETDWNEIEKRDQDIISGKSTGHSWEEVKNTVRKN